MYLQNSVYNHCHPVKRSEDVTMEAAAVPSLFNHPHNTLHDNQERQVEGNTLSVGCRKAALIWLGFPNKSAFLSFPWKGHRPSGCAHCQAASPSWLADEWRLHAAWWPGMPYPLSLSTSDPAVSSESQWSIIVLAPLQHPKVSSFVCCPLSPPLPGKQKG